MVAFNFNKFTPQHKDKKTETASKRNQFIFLKKLIVFLLRTCKVHVGKHKSLDLGNF